jgi:hypothetical protein
MTASLPERPPGRVHWQFAKVPEAPFEDVPDGLPPWVPPDDPVGELHNRDSIHFHTNTT